MIYINCITLLLLHTTNNGLTRGRKNTDIMSKMLEEQQRFFNEATELSKENVKDSASQSDNLKEIKQVVPSNYFSLNYQSDSKLNNKQDVFAWFNDRLDHLKKVKGKGKKKGYRNNENHEQDDYIAEQNKDDGNLTDWVTHHKIEKAEKPKHIPKGPKTKKNHTHDITRIDFKIRKLWCAARVNGNIMKKFIECFHDITSVKKIKYVAKVLLYNKPQKDFENFLRCLSIIKTYPELKDKTTRYKEQLTDCFLVHGMSGERLISLLYELITEQEKKRLENLYHCFKKAAAEHAPRHIKDCIDEEPVIFVVVDRIRKIYLKNNTMVRSPPQSESDSSKSSSNSYESEYFEDPDAV